jgi:hypothetical protein
MQFDIRIRRVSGIKRTHPRWDTFSVMVRKHKDMRFSQRHGFDVIVMRCLIMIE